MNVLALLGSFVIVGHVGAVPVRAPAQPSGWGACPAQVLPVSDLRAARQAVLGALPALKIRGPVRVEVVRHTHRNGDVLPDRRACWGRPFLRSVLVWLYLPGERASPDLSGNPAFYVARTPSGWVIWGRPH